MKSLEKFILESVGNKNLQPIIKRMMTGFDYSALKIYSGEDDPKRFDLQKDNEELIAQQFDKIDLGDLEALTTSDFYALENNGGLQFDKLSSKEKSEYDAKNGDIILINDDDEAVYKIDVKISDKFLGTISLGSVVNFDKDGWYLLICTGGKYFKLVSHKDVEDALKSGKLKLNEPTNKYKGYDVDWNGDKLTSEYFIKGNDLRKL